MRQTGPPPTKKSAKTATPPSRDKEEDAQDLRHALLRDGSLVLDVKVTPRSRTGRISEPMAGGILKVAVTAAPEKGRANDEVCEVLAEYLGVPKRNVDVILGRTSRLKRVKVLRSG